MEGGGGKDDVFGAENLGMETSDTTLFACGGRGGRPEGSDVRDEFDPARESGFICDGGLIGERD